MIRITHFAVCPAAAAIFTLFAVAPVSAQDSKEDSCKYQGQVMSAVQGARLERVKIEDVEKHILDSEPVWPETYSKAIPQLSAHVYALKRRDLKNVDLGAAFEEQCLSSWDQIQELQKQLQNG